MAFLTFMFLSSTILLGTRKMVRAGGIGLALSDPHFCILPRDRFNLSREYFSLWTMKTSLDRNASAVLDQEVLFSRVARHLACVAFCNLQVGIFSKICAIHRLNRLVLHALNMLLIFIVRGYWPMLFSIVTSLLFVVFIERSIFSSSRNLLFDHNSRT